MGFETLGNHGLGDEFSDRPISLEFGRVSDWHDGGAHDGVTADDSEEIEDLPDDPGLFTDCPALKFKVLPALSPLERPDDEPDRSFLSFRQTFDGSQPEIPAKEQIEAGTAFAEFVDSEVAEGFSREEVRTDDSGDQLLVRLSKERLSMPPVGHAEKRMLVEGFGWTPQGPRLTGYAASYKLDIDGAVRRSDYRPSTLEQYAKNQQRLDAIRAIAIADPATMTGGEVRAIVTGLKTSLNELLAEHLMPQELGEQNQPVGPEEVENLIRLARGH